MLVAGLRKVLPPTTMLSTPTKYCGAKEHGTTGSNTAAVDQTVAELVSDFFRELARQRDCTLPESDQAFKAFEALVRLPAADDNFEPMTTARSGTQRECVLSEDTLGLATSIVVLVLDMVL